MDSYARQRMSRTDHAASRATLHAAGSLDRIDAFVTGGHRSTLRAFGSAAARLVVAIVLLGCSTVNSSSDKPPTAEQRLQFEREASVTFPASAELIAWREERGIDGAVWLKFKIPAADFQAFIDKSPLQKTPLAASDKYQEHQFRDLLPVTPTRYRAGQQALPSGRVLNILADESDPKTVVVYLMLHET